LDRTNRHQNTRFRVVEQSALAGSDDTPDCQVKAMTSELPAANFSF